MKPEEMARPAADEAEAAQLDRLINERKSADVPPPSTPEEALIDQMIHLAATTEPTPHFVAQLEQQIQKQFRQQEREQFRGRRPATLWMTTFPFAADWLFRRSKFALAVTLLLLLFTLLLTPPVVRATLWDWLYGFGLIDEAQVTGQSIPSERPTPPGDASVSLTLPEIQQQAPFAFQPPIVLPAGLHFTGGFVMPTATETSVTLAYHTTPAPADGYPLDAPLLFVAVSDGALPNRPLVAEGYQQAVRIGQDVGIYTHGAWQSATLPEATDTQTGPLFWDSSADAAWLTWQANGLNYLLYAQGLGFTAETMAQIAASME